MGFNIKITNLSKYFGKKKIIDNVSLNITSSESTVILGQSGMGKSVFLNLLGLLHEPTSGSLIYDNIETFKILESEKNKIIKKIGFLFQNCGLFDNLNILENVCFFDLFIKDNSKKDKKTAKEKAVQKLESLKIPSSSFYMKPYEISGGMQKRVAITRILMGEPELILLDEPTSGLDPITSELVNETIIEMKKIIKSTIITITHDLHSALQISDRILVLKDGKFIWDNKSKEIFNSNIDYVQKFVSASNIKR